jgi:hypothetical protein
MSGVSVTTAAIGGGAIIAAGILEELTHVAAAVPFAARQEIDWRHGEVTHEIAEDADAADVWIALAPLVVGLVGLGLWAVGIGLPPLDRANLLLYVAWAWYSIPSITDLQAAAGVESSGDGWDDPRYRDAWYGLSAQMIGMLLLIGGWADLAIALTGDAKIFLYQIGSQTDVIQWQVSRALRMLGVGLMPAGAAWALLGVWLHDRDND